MDQGGPWPMLADTWLRQWYVFFRNMHGHDSAFVEIDPEAGCFCKLIQEQF